ncbi:MAG: hypothetical protein KA028_01315 [Candidatus Pacebacteria bacterium]|nr:hypothetical protein [Candidatus Paceibacterota bacterium]MBP9852295.1 hypothetical protein [Candidatus Paceibacterota bacterium]
MKNTSRLFVALGIVLILIVIYAMVKKSPEAPIDQTSTPASNIVEASISYTEGQPFTPKVIQAKQGQEVMVSIASNVVDTAHLHGYDISTPLTPTEPNTLRFTAENTGRFDLELHDADKVIAIFEVYPN